MGSKIRIDKEGCKLNVIGDFLTISHETVIFFTKERPSDADIKKALRQAYPELPELPEISATSWIKIFTNVLKSVGGSVEYYSQDSLVYEDRKQGWRYVVSLRISIDQDISENESPVRAARILDEMKGRMKQLIQEIPTAMEYWSRLIREPC